jgi:hypothetical protein
MNDQKLIEKFKEEIHDFRPYELITLSNLLKEALKGETNLLILWNKISLAENNEFLHVLLKSIEWKTALAVAISEIFQGLAKKNPRSAKVNYGKMTRKQKEVAGKKIALLMREGKMSQAQAIAVGLKYGAKSRRRKHVSR